MGRADLLTAGDELDEVETDLRGMSQMLSMVAPSISDPTYEMLSRFLECQAGRVAAASAAISTRLDEPEQ